LLTNNCVSTEAWTIPVELQAGREYDFACETANYTIASTEMHYSRLR
jgi:hypothetical protein